jgi:holliday junction DNA helicase RuvB
MTFRDKYLSNLKINSVQHNGRKTDDVDIFAPQTFEEYIGQENAKAISKVIINAAKIEHRSLPNIMVTGTYGTGKTTLARLALRAYNGQDSVVDAASVNRATPTKGTLIIDEIHNLNSEVADTLNTILDKGQLHIIGCTTNPGALSSAFRSRFRSVNLEPYTVENITEILELATARKGYEPTVTLKDIAKRSRFNPRTGLTYLATIFDYMAIQGKKLIDEGILDQVFGMLGVDRRGYTKRDKQYLAAMPDDRPVGIQYISAITGIDVTTIETEIEPYLMQTGLIDRTSRGRMKIGDI